MKNEISHDKAFEFMIAGNCHVVIYNSETSNQRRFIIKARYVEPRTKYEKVDKHKMENIMCYYIYDMDKKKHDNYLGTINKEIMKFFDKGTKDQELSRNFAWVWTHVIEHNLPSTVHIMHLGQCSFCGRPLKDAFSLERGIGPVCFNSLFPPKSINNENFQVPNWLNNSNGGTGAVTDSQV